MRHPKLVAALAALTLTVGGLALAGPALAQEVPSSPDTPVQVLTETAPTEAPTAPEKTDNSSASPEAHSATPEAEAPDETNLPTEPSPSVNSPSPSDSPTAPTPSTDSSDKPESSTPASNTEEPEHTSPASVEGWWLLTNGGTATNVTWPQAVTEANVVPCGVTAQVDTYPSAEVLATLQADGQLDQGEDYSTVISWRFVYGGDCPPAPGPANPAATIETQCGLATVTVTNDGENILTASVVIYLDGDFLTALAVPAGQSVTTPVGVAEDSGDHVLSVRTGPAFGDVELATGAVASDCQPPVVVTPPTEPPVFVPPATTPTPEPTDQAAARTIAAREYAETEKLADTGSNTDLGWIFGGGAIIAFIVGVGLLLGRKRKA